MYSALTIAGSDSSGGAGIQADLKTFAVNGVYGMSVITAVTAQNTTGVKAVENISPRMVEEQIDAVFTDIFPDAVKIGMVSSQEIIKVISEKLKQYRPENIVLDPVMVATSGDALCENSAMQALVEELMPLATVLTPNIHEAEMLTGCTIKNKEDMLLAARKLSKNYKGILLIKGGHLTDCADDLIYNSDNAYYWLQQKRIDNPNTHGTGCTLSSAIAANLAKGRTAVSAIEEAQRYVYGAIKNGMDIGRGNGPLNHLYKIFK